MHPSDPPYLARAMHTQFVDAFFADGPLRIPSWSKLREHDDAARRDVREGTAHLILTTPTLSAQYVSWEGRPAYVLCASATPFATLPHDQSVLRIVDAQAFCDEVAQCIPSFTHAKRGYCIYTDDRNLNKVQSTPLPEMPIPSPDVPFDGDAWERDLKQWNIASSARLIGEVDDCYFIKPTAFVHEAEYRFIWFTSGPCEPYIEIACPSARVFCNRDS
jgi:hypothetical protein